MQTEYYLVSKDIFTESMLKTLEVKELMESNREKSIHAAVKKAGISRSAYYKYKDKIHKVTESPGQIICLYLLLEDKANILAGVIGEIGRVKANILTINQEIPLGGTARVSIYIEARDMDRTLDALLESILQKRGVLRADFSRGGA
ncbi:MAG: ACT domain-containing protein [Clostridia bacterium]